MRKSTTKGNFGILLIMKLYRFSPIKSKDDLYEAVRHMHVDAHQLCFNSLGEHLSVAGNVGVFCHYDDEYRYLLQLRDELVNLDDNWMQKYFALKEPIVFATENGIPAATYDYLYIRRPDPYRAQVGDIDFYLTPEKYAKLRDEMKAGKVVENARIFPEERLDMIELHSPDIDTLSYISDTFMRDLAREK